jgi:hypothetical protein
VVIAIALVLSLIFVCSQPYASPFPASFPGTSEAPDPTCRYSVLWFDNSPHELFFKDLKTGQSSSLLVFTRWVEGRWSPDGNAFAITDHSGSSESSVLVVRTGGPLKLLNLEDVFVRSFGKPDEIYENGHIYFEALEWINSTTLLFKIQAHDAYPDRMYEATFRYELGDGISKEMDLKK